MAEHFLQDSFAERIGGSGFGKDTTIYKFEKIKRAKQAAKAARPDVELIDMGVGEPDEAAFPEVVARLGEEAGKWENRTYSDNGVMSFRETVRDYMSETFGVSLDPDTEINHSIGSKSALSLLPAAFINPGDVTIMTTPGYPVLGTWSKYLGGEVINLPIHEGNDFFPDLDSLTDDQKKRAKLLYLNYPNNPTGACATEAQFQKAIDFARENNVLIVSDAAYAALNFSGKPLSILALPGGMDCAVELHSMSKGFNMTGWRLGWVCGNSLAVNAFATVKDNADSGQFAAIQKAAAWALENQSSITPLISEKYERRLQALTEILRGAGFPATCPGGSFFLYVKAPTGLTDGTRFSNAEEVSQWLIREKLISTVPWDNAGAYVRFSATFVAKGEGGEEKALAAIAERLSDVSFIWD
jgi:LL-diaminopimelate aminotransferase